MPDPAESVRVLRSADRFRSDADGILTRHCFAFGNHYDPDNTGFGDLVAVNDEQVGPGRGYDLHRHRDSEIVTWVLDGALEHEDSAGHAGTIAVGTVQRMSAGSGVRHAERNASDRQPLRFVQMWLRATTPDAAPSYDQADITERLARPEFVPAVGAPGEATIGIDTADATLWIARLGPGDEPAVPDAPLRHLHVVRGSVGVDGEALDAGDTMRVRGALPVSLRATTPSEVLLWAMRPSS